MKRLLAALSIVCAVTTPALAREGFGFSKKGVNLTRTTPPSTNAGARRVKVTVTSDRGDARDDAQTLSRYLSEAILGGAGTLADTGRAEVTIDVSLDRVESHESYDTETEYVREQTGTRRKWNEKKQKYEDEKIYSNRPVQKTYKTLTASVTGAYEIAARNADVASGSVDQQFREKYGDGESSRVPSDVEDQLLRGVAKVIVSNLVPTQDEVRTLLPRSTFESLIPLAESGQWDKYLASVEAVSPNRNEKDEAYRQFALGVAREAIAYETTDRREALEMLRQAVSHYDLAIQMNPAEELFRKDYVSIMPGSNTSAPARRAKESLALYEKWVSATGVSRTSPRDRDPAPDPPRAPEPPQSATVKQGMRNQTVIDLVKAGLSDENVILAIDGAERTAFDVTPEGLISLAKAGVSKAVIARMQKKAKR